MDEDKVAKIDRNKVPQHIAIIMDGNRRWAKENGKNPIQGHNAGVESINRLSIFQTKKSPIQIKTITLYALSEDNKNKRPEKEVSGLMTIFKKGFTDIAKDKRIQENKIRISVFGKYKSLPQGTVDAIDSAIKKTAGNNEFFLNFCIAYDGQSELVEAFKKIVQKSDDTKSAIQNINKDTIKKNIYSQSFAAPDLIIRTGKEKRLSGFMLWDSSYSELMFLDKHWPEITEEDILDSIIEHQKRDRRFGQ